MVTCKLEVCTGIKEGAGMGSLMFCLHASTSLAIPYKNKYWRGTKFGELENRHAIIKFKSHQYIFL